MRPINMLSRMSLSIASSSHGGILLVEHEALRFIFVLETCGIESSRIWYLLVGYLI